MVSSTGCNLMQRYLLLIALLFQINAVAQQKSRGLEFYLSEGQKNSPLLNDFRNQMEAAQADSLIARAANKPFIEARSQLQYFPVYGNFGYDEAITNGGTYTAVMGVSQNILNKRTMDNRYRAGNLKKQYAGASSRLTSAELNRLITNEYITVYTLFRDLEFNKSFLALSEEENYLIKDFVSGGITRQTDYMALLLETQSQEILAGELEGQFRKEMATLYRMCGLVDTTYYVPEEPAIIMTGIADISSSPVLLQYNIDSLRIENEKVAVDIKYHPRISWFADAGFLTSNPWNFSNHFGYSAGLSLNVPVYDGKQKNIEKRKLVLDENSRKFYADNYKKQYGQKVVELGNEMKSLNETSARLEKQLKLSDQLVKALKIQLETGNVIMTDYINAIRNFRNINRNILMINLEKLQIINEMNHLQTQQ